MSKRNPELEHLYTREILVHLVAIGKITQQDIIKAKQLRIVTSALDRVHLATCKLNHDNGECKWYEEGQFEDKWKRPFHKEWLRLFNNFLTSTKLVKFIPEGVTEEASGTSND